MHAGIILAFNKEDTEGWLGGKKEGSWWSFLHLRGILEDSPSFL
jgi:hypothetical protein